MWRGGLGAAYLFPRFDTLTVTPFRLAVPQ